MPDALGILSALGIKVVSGWTSAYSAVDTLVPYTSESFSQAYSRLQNDALLGSAGRKESSQGVQACQGNTVHQLDYNNFDDIFEMFFGAKSTRTFTLSDDPAVLAVKNLYLEFEKQVSRWRWGACKCPKLMISGEKDGIVQLTADWIARDIDRNGTAFPLTESDLTGAINLVRFEDLDFWITTVAAGPPTSGDRVRIESFSLEMDRGLVGDDYVSKDGASGEKFPLEPIVNAFREVTFKIKLARYASDADFLAWKDADTAVQAKMTFTRSGETFVLDLPHLKIVEGFDAQIGGAERLQLEGGFDCYRPDSTNPLYTGGEVRAVFT